MMCSADGRPYPGFGRRRRLAPDEIPHVPPSLTVARGKHVLGFVDAVGKDTSKNPFMPKAPAEAGPIEENTEHREKKPKRESVFTEIPLELEDVFLHILLTQGFRNADAQRARSNLRAIVAEINDARENPNRLIELFVNAMSIMHPTDTPQDREVRHTQEHIAEILKDPVATLILKDPVGYIALDIMHVAEGMRIPISPMNYSIVERLTQLRDERSAAKPIKRRHMAKPR